MLTPDNAVFERLLAEPDPDDPYALTTAAQALQQRTDLVVSAINHVCALTYLHQALETFPLSDERLEELEAFVRKERRYG